MKYIITENKRLKNGKLCYLLLDEEAYEIFKHTDWIFDDNHAISEEGQIFEISELMPFIEIKECERDENPLSIDETYPLNQIDFMNGWISPDGITHSTLSEDVLSKASEKFSQTIVQVAPFNPTLFLYDSGWISCVYESDLNLYEVKTGENVYITREQYTTLMNLNLLTYLDKSTVERSIYNWQKEEEDT